MPSITANNITLEFDTFGNESHEPLLLVMGLGAQMTAIDLLAAKPFNNANSLGVLDAFPTLKLHFERIRCQVSSLWHL